MAFEHPAYGAEMATIATDLAKRGPALGIIQMLATQRPDAKSIPTGVSANVVLRFCLKVMGQTENDMILGTSPVQGRHPGHHVRPSTTRASSTSPARACGRGSCAASTSTGRTAKSIVARARVMREAAGRITGYALGEDGDQEVRSFAADVLMVFGADDKLWCETIAARLRRLDPLGLRRHHQGRRGEPAARPRGRRQVGPRDRQGTAVGLRAGRRRGGRAAARSVAEAPGCVVLPQHALTWPDTAAPLQPLHRGTAVTCGVAA